MRSRHRAWLGGKVDGVVARAGLLRDLGRERCARKGSERKCEMRRT